MLRRVVMIHRFFLSLTIMLFFVLRSVYAVEDLLEENDLQHLRDKGFYTSSVGQQYAIWSWCSDSQGLGLLGDGSVLEKIDRFENVQATFVAQNIINETFRMIIDPSLKDQNKLSYEISQAYYAFKQRRTCKRNFLNCRTEVQDFSQDFKVKPTFKENKILLILQVLVLVASSLTLIVYVALILTMFHKPFFLFIFPKVRQIR